jgi:hypothetical protein
VMKLWVTLYCHLMLLMHLFGVSSASRFHISSVTFGPHLQLSLLHVYSILNNTIKFNFLLSIYIVGYRYQVKFKFILI